MFINIKPYILDEDWMLLKNKSKNKELMRRNLELVREARKGNVDARNYLFLLNLPNIIYTISKSFNIDTRMIYEYISESFEYFIEAIIDYDESTNNNFLAFLKIKIKTRFKNSICNKKQKDRRDRTIYIDTDDEEKDYDKYLCNDDSNFENINLNFSETEKDVKQDLFYNKEKMINVARKFGVSYQEIRKIKESIIRKENE